MQEFINKIVRGDSLFVLKRLPDKSVHCIVTSPPYWGLRDYKVEPTALTLPKGAFINHLDYLNQHEIPNNNQHSAARINKMV